MDVVTRPPTRVAYLKSADRQEEITRAWSLLEDVVPLRGNRFYGAFFPDRLEYWACVELREGGPEPAPASALLEGTLPGGRYARERLRGTPPAVYAEIAPAFDRMSRAYPGDPSRPSLELYRSHEEIDVLLPITG